MVQVRKFEPWAELGTDGPIGYIIVQESVMYSLVQGPSLGEPVGYTRDEDTLPLYLVATGVIEEHDSRIVHPFCFYKA